MVSHVATAPVAAHVTPSAFVGQGITGGVAVRFSAVQTDDAHWQPETNTTALITQKDIDTPKMSELIVSRFILTFFLCWKAASKH